MAFFSITEINQRIGRARAVKAEDFSADHPAGNRQKQQRKYQQSKDDGGRRHFVAVPRNMKPCVLGVSSI